MIGFSNHADEVRRKNTLKKFALIAALPLLAACMTPAATDEATAASQFVGKTLTSDGGTVFLFQDGGVVGGTFRGETPIVGTYTATATQICSTYSAPQQLTGREFCSTPVVTGNTVVFDRTDGSQSPAYTISN